jgi:hypothetical protein
MLADKNTGTLRRRTIRFGARASTNGKRRRSIFRVTLVIWGVKVGVVMVMVMDVGVIGRGMGGIAMVVGRNRRVSTIVMMLR